jgi:hypothetical protein
MATYRSSVSVEASVHETFAFVRELRNFPRYVERVTAVEPLGGEAIRVTLVDGDHHRTVEAHARVHESGRHRRVEWGVEGSGHYHGWVEIDQEGEVCSVTMEVHASEVDGAEVDAALWALKAAVEAR